jgi:hypothetical protein
MQKLKLKGENERARERDRGWRGKGIDERKHRRGSRVPLSVARNTRRSPSGKKHQVKNQGKMAKW